MKEFKAGKNEAGQRLDKYLKTNSRFFCQMIHLLSSPSMRTV